MDDDDDDDDDESDAYDKHVDYGEITLTSAAYRHM